MTFFMSLMAEVWNILLDASFFILLGIVIAGLLKVSLNPNTILEHLGKGRFVSVVKAAFFGVPLPL
jgi:uncharacterized membrane protein YraQ (UPF0718 family)